MRQCGGSAVFAIGALASGAVLAACNPCRDEVFCGYVDLVAPCAYDREGCILRPDRFSPCPKPNHGLPQNYDCEPMVVGRSNSAQSVEFFVRDHLLAQPTLDTLSVHMAVWNFIDDHPVVPIPLDTSLTILVDGSLGSCVLDPSACGVPKYCPEARAYRCEVPATAYSVTLRIRSPEVRLGLSVDLSESVCTQQLCVHAL